MANRMWHKIWTIACYENKVIKRDFLFWLFMFLAIGVITFYQAVYQGDFGKSTLWCLVSMPSAIPLVNAYLFTIFQSFILLFICTNLYRRESRIDSLQMIDTRPFGNVVYTLGKALGIFLVFFQLNFFSSGIAFLINLFASPAPLDVSLYFYYFFTLSFPSLCFFVGFSFFIIRGTRHPVLGLLVLLGCLGGILFLLPFSNYGVFDILGISLPNFFSQVTGHPFSGVFLLQRFSVFVFGCFFLCASILFSRRIFNYKKGRKMVMVFSFILLGIGGILLKNYYHVFQEAENSRSIFRLVFLKYDREKYAHVERHEICYNQRGSDLYLSSDLTITNTRSSALDRVILYLNPGLKIKSMTGNGIPLSYVRDHQVIVIDRVLLPTDTLRLFMEYEGRVNEEICYLDKPLRVSSTYGDTPFRFGQRYAYVENDYTLLLPEILWYPVTLPPTNLRYPELSRFDFTSFILHLPRQNQRTIITQGISSFNKKQITFRSTEKYPGLTLCIGDYEKKYVWMGKYSVELYYFRGHNFFERFSLLDKTEVQNMIWNLSFQNRLPAYPYERLCFVESPISFFSPVRDWKGTSDFVQPGIVFLPEQGTTLERRASSVNIYSGRDLEGEQRKIAEQRNQLENLASGTLLSTVSSSYKGNFPVERLFALREDVSDKYGISSLYIKPLFYDYSCFLHSAEMPVVDRALRIMEIERKNAYQYGGINPFQDNSSCLSYFSENSLKTALQDKTLSTTFRERLINLKALELHAYLRSHIPGDSLARFLTDFRNSHRYEWTTLGQFNAVLESRFSLDIQPFLNEWYNNSKLPSFHIRDVKCWRVKSGANTGGWKIHFKVRNEGEADGAIVALIAPNSHKPHGEYYFWIPAGATKEIKLWYRDMGGFYRLTLSTGIASNLPDFFEYYFYDLDVPLTSDRETGIFDCSSDVFRPNPGEIIIDNEDAGFCLIEGDEQKNLATLYGKKEKYKDFMKASSRWQYTLCPYFYGNKIKSACLKLAGDGKAKAIWNAEIPEKGVYEVFTRHVSFGTSRLSTVYEDLKLYYTVVQDREESEVVLELDDSFYRFRGCRQERWLSLGEFEFKAGQVKVIVDDRGEKLEDAQQLIFADAVKFVRKK